MPKNETSLFESHQPMWRVRELVKHLGGPEQLTKKLEAKGYRPPLKNAMQGWITRNQIPAPWLPAVLGLAMDEHLIAHPEELLLRETM